MKLKHIAIASAMALAGVSSQAFALGAFDAADETIFLSGASAPDAFLASIATGLFTGTAADPIFTYKDDNGTAATTDDGKLYTAYFGVVKTDASIPASLHGKKVRLIKRSDGGSVWGVNPVARASSIATLKIASASCTLTGTNTYACPKVGVDPGVGTPTGDEMVPDFGVSDVAPNMFKGPLNVEFGQSELSADEVAGLTVKGVNTLMMGLAVTNAVPTTTYFDRANYGAMLNGSITEWIAAGAAAAPAAGNQVVVCRRVPGSGTQTSYNWFFSNFPCTTNSIAGSGALEPSRMGVNALIDTDAVPNDGLTAATAFEIDPTAGYTVIENSSSGLVRTCLNKAQNGGVHEFIDEEGKYYKVNFGSGGYGAIGVLSVDSHGKETNATEGGWSFRNMDGAGALGTASSSDQTVTGTGVAPTQANLMEGKYEFAGELTMQYRNDLSGLKKDFADEFIKRAGAASFQKKWTAALFPNETPVVNAAGVLTSTNIARATRNGNMCAPLQKLF